MNDNPFLVPDTNYKSTASIKENFNSDGAIPTDNEENPFLVAATSTEENPFLVEDTKHNWGTTDARDAGKVNPGMAAPERKGSPADRMNLMMQQGFATGVFTGRKDGTLEAAHVRDMENWWKIDPASKTPEMVASVEAHRKQAIDKLSKYLALRKDISADIEDANPSFLEQVTGGIVPSLQDPVNIVPVAKGAKLVSTIAKGATGGLMLGIASAWEQGQYDKAIGLINKDPELKELIKSGFDTAMIVAAINGFFHIRGQYHKGAYDRKPKGPDADLTKAAEDYVKSQASMGKVDPEKGIDASSARSPYKLPPLYSDADLPPGGSIELPPDATGLTRNKDLNITNVRNSNAYNEFAASKGLEQIPGMAGMEEKVTNEKALNQPYWPDPELQNAIKEANYSADNPNAIPDVDAREARNPFLNPEQLTEAQKWADQGKPGYGEMEVPQEAANIPYWPDADLEAAKASANRRANAIDNLPNSAEVSTDVQGIKSPYMDRQQLIDAQNQVDKTGEPAHSQMEIPEEMGNAPYWPDKALERAKASANRQADKVSATPVTETPKVELTPEQNAKIDAKIDELFTPEKMSEEEAMSRFLKVASRRGQGGHLGIDPSENVGLGWNDTAAIVRRGAKLFWESVAPSFKKNFDSAFKSKDGTPSFWFHGTNERGLKNDLPFTKYEADRGDGALVHLGQVSSSTIINDRLLKNSVYFHTNFPNTTNVSEVKLKSFKDWIIERGISDEILDGRTEAGWKKLRDDWYKYRDETINSTKKGIDEHLTKISNEVLPAIKSLGTKEVLNLLDQPSVIEMIYKDFIDYGTLTEYGMRGVALGKYLHDIGVFSPNNSVTIRFIKAALKHSEAKKALDIIKSEVLGELSFQLDKTYIPSGHHMRPAIVSVKNPLMIRDIGVWNDLDQLINELLPKQADRYKLNGSNWEASSPVPPQMLLGEVQGSRFTLDLLDLKEKYKSDLGRSREHFKEFYKILEKYGFDGILYENNAEAITRKHIEQMSANADPVLSLAVWNTKKIHDLVDVPRVTKKERGSITLPGIGKETPKAPQTPEEAVAALNKDIGWERYIPMTMNQKAMFLRNPVIKFAYDKMREFTNEADVRFNTYKTYLHDVETFFRKNRQESLKMLKVLADIQDPKLKEARQLAQDSNTREQFLVDQGMPEKYVPMAIKILDVLQAVGKVDQKMALDAFGHNWHLEPMYFPREHTGPFSVTVVDGSGNVSYMKGFEHSKLAQMAGTALKEKLKGTDYVVEVTRNEPNTIGDIFTMLDINEPDKMPDFLRGITEGMLKELEVAKRKFEMERAPENVAGYTGDTIYGETNFFKSKYDQDTRLLTLLQRRLEGSFSLETKARLLKEVKEPLLADPTLLGDKPNTTKMLQEMIAREWGLDISKLQDMGRSVDKKVEAFGKIVNKLVAPLEGREAWDVSYFKPNEVARMAQAYVWAMSIIKLGLSPSTLAANTSTMFMTPVDGIRTAAKLGVSQMVPAAAMLKTMASHFDAEAMKFMKEADAEGMVEARLADPLHITNTHARSITDRIVNKPRDAIEKATNYSSLLYYYNFYKLAYPDLSPSSREFKTKVYESVRSWTGDYAYQAQLLAVSKLGSVGHLQSNFAKWKFNQLGRLADDVRMIGEGKVMPAIMTMAMTTLMAGAMGAPIAVEYEALRRLGMKLGWWDWKPLSAFLHELKADGIIPDAAIKGPMTYYADQAAKKLGLTAPDMSGNLRHSSFLDINTLPVQYGVDVYKSLTGMARHVYKAANNYVGGTYPGNTVQQEKDMFKGMPVVLENIYQERMNQKYGGDSGVSQYATKDAGQYQRNKQEQNLAYLGFRSKDENDFKDLDYSRGWQERKDKTDFTKAKELIIANIDKPENLTPLAQKIFELKGVEGILETIKAVEETIKSRQTDSYSRDLVKQINNPNAVAQMRSLELLKKFKPNTTPRSLSQRE